MFERKNAATTAPRERAETVVVTPRIPSTGTTGHVEAGGGGTSGGP